MPVILARVGGCGEDLRNGREGGGERRREGVGEERGGKRRRRRGRGEESELGESKELEEMKRRRGKK